MRISPTLRRAILLLIVAAALAACAGGSPPVAPAPAVPPTAALPAPTAEAGGDGGGPEAGEVDLAAGLPLPVAADPSTPTPPPVASPAPATVAPSPTPPATPTATPTVWPSKDPHPLQIAVMRGQPFPGSAITFEQKLSPGANYSRWVVSYRSDGYKIYALMTIPNGQKPATGWPAIVFNHGYIPPPQYRTTERYVAYVDALARSGYIVFKSDYRGHGSSEGRPVGGYGAPDYTVDVLNALASVRAYPDADPGRIGMWGHSLGGQLTLRAMVVAHDVRAGVIWGGVVAPYPDIFLRPTPSRPRPTPLVSPTPSATAFPGELGPYGLRNWRQGLTAKYGSPQQNPEFWASISPNSYLKDLSGPLELHHSVTDEEVPVASSQALFRQAQAAGVPVQLYTYPGDNHNISANFALAMQRTIAFFNRYVKGA